MPQMINPFFTCLIILTLFFEKESIAQEFTNNYLLQTTKEIEKIHPIFSNRNKNQEWEDLLMEVSNTEKLNRVDYAFLLSKIISFTKDPHTQIKNLNVFLDPVPIFVQYFEGDWRITTTNNSNKNLLGSKILSINNFPIDQVIKEISTIMPCNNDGCIRAFLPQYIYFPQMLSKLNLGDSCTSMQLEIENILGSVEVVHLNTIRFEQWKQELIFFRPDSISLRKSTNKDYIWSETIPKDSLYYVRINSFEGPSKNFKKIAKSILLLKQQPNVKKLFIDVRDNLGGQAQLSYPILRAVIESPDIKTYLAINHYTFSASIVFSELLNQYTNVSVVGNLYGDISNHYSEPVHYTLNDSNLKVTISTKYYHNTVNTSALNRLIKVSLKFDDYKTGKDPIYDFVKDNRESQPTKINAAKSTSLISLDIYPKEYSSSYDFYLAQQANISDEVFDDYTKAVKICKEGIDTYPDSPYLMGTLGLLRLKKWNIIGGIPKVFKAVRLLKRQRKY